MLSRGNKFLPASGARPVLGSPIVWSLGSLAASTLAFGRGIFDAVGLQTLGYVAQYGLLGAVMCVAWLEGFRRRLARSGAVALAAAATVVFVLAVFLSWFVTLLVRGFVESWVYAAVSLFWAWFLFSSVLLRQVLQQAPWVKWVVICGAVNAVVGLLQQAAGLVALPGGSWYGGVFRPPGVFGSMQHYSIALALTSLYAGQAYLAMASRWSGIAAVLMSVAVVMSLTRSGYVVLGGGVLGYAAVRLLRAVGRARVGGGARWVAVAAAVAAAAWVVGEATGVPPAVLGERLVGVFDPLAAGNPERLEAWGKGIDTWATGAVLLGADTGLATQSTRKVFPEAESINVESGVIQQLVNFGIIGTLAFYGLLVALVASVDRGHTLMRAGMIAALLQSMVYMSIETVPYLFLMGVGPAVSARLRAEVLGRAGSREHAESECTRKRGTAGTRVEY